MATIKAAKTILKAAKTTIKARHIPRHKHIKAILQSKSPGWSINNMARTPAMNPKLTATTTTIPTTTDIKGNKGNKDIKGNKGNKDKEMNKGIQEITTTTGTSIINTTTTERDSSSTLRKGHIKMLSLPSKRRPWSSQSRLCRSRCQSQWKSRQRK